MNIEVSRRHFMKLALFPLSVLFGGGRLVRWLPPILASLPVTSIGLWEQGLGSVQEWTGFYPTIEQKRLAAMIHATAAVLAIAIWIIHVYAAIWVRGTLSGMTRGSVSGGYGWRHHRKWLRNEVDRGEVDRPRVTGRRVASLRTSPILGSRCS